MAGACHACWHAVMQQISVKIAHRHPQLHSLPQPNGVPRVAVRCKQAVRIQVRIQDLTGKGHKKATGSPLQCRCSSVLAHLRPQWPQPPALRAPSEDPPGGAGWGRPTAGHAGLEGTASQSHSRHVGGGQQYSTEQTADKRVLVSTVLTLQRLQDRALSRHA
jgi:hypothetical protein